MTLVTIPNRPAGTDPRSISAILADFDAITGVINGNLDGQNVVASLTGRKLLALNNIIFGSTFPGSTWLMLGVGGGTGPGASPATLSISSNQQPFEYLDPANFAVVGKNNTQMIIKASVASNGTPIGCNVTGALLPVTFSGGSGALVITAGAPVTGSSVTINAPAANSVATAETAAFTFPAAGAYMFGYMFSAAPAANALAMLTLQAYALNS